MWRYKKSVTQLEQYEFNMRHIREWERRRKEEPRSCEQQHPELLGLSQSEERR